MTMSRSEAVTAFARLSKDPEFLRNFAAGQIEAVNAQREIAAAMVGEDKVNFQSGRFTQDELKTLAGPS